MISHRDHAISAALSQIIAHRSRSAATSPSKTALCGAFFGQLASQSSAIVRASCSFAHNVASPLFAMQYHRETVLISALQ